MSDLLDSDGPDYDPDAFAYAVDLARKAGLENGRRVSPVGPPAPDDVRCETRRVHGAWRYRCIHPAGHTGGCHLRLEATMNHVVCKHGDPDEVFVDGVRVDPARSQQLWNHSPDGFSWGYGGSGPAQLALAILLAVGVEDDRAVRHHQQFKFDVVARWPMDDDVDDEVDVLGWVRAREEAFTSDRVG